MALNNDKNNFISDLVNQILTSLSSKLTQLNERKIILEQYIELNKNDTTDSDLIRAQSKYDEILDSINFEKRFEKHFIQISDDVKIYKEILMAKDKIEKEEAVKTSLKDGLQYLNAFNYLFNSAQIATEILKKFNLNPNEYLILKNFNDLLQSERKMCYDINIDHLSNLVTGSCTKITSMDLTYTEIKNILDRILSKNSLSFKNDSLTLKSSQSAVPIQLNNNNSLPPITKPIIKVMNHSNTDEIIEINKKNGDYKENDSNIKRFKINSDADTQEDVVIYKNVNLTKLAVEMKDTNFNRESYAYMVTKLLFSRDERLSCWFPDTSHTTSRFNRQPFDSERTQILLNTINSTKFKLSTNLQIANNEWDDLRRMLNQKNSKNLKRKSTV